MSKDNFRTIMTVTTDDLREDVAELVRGWTDKEVQHFGQILWSAIADDVYDAISIITNRPKARK